MGLHRTLVFSAATSLVLGCHPDSDTQVPDTGDLVVPEAESQRLLDHVEILASDEYGGREPGTDGGVLAELYLEEHFSALGLEGAGDDGGFRHHFPLQRYTVTGPSELALDGVDYTAGQDFELFTYSGAGQVEAELVFVSYGLTVPAFDVEEYPGCPLDPAGYDDYQGVDVTGRVALVARHGPTDDWDIGDYCPVNEAGAQDGDLFAFGYKAANAAAHGASAMLLFTDFTHPDALAEPGNISEEYYHEDLPALFVDRDVLEAHVPDLRTWQEEIDATLQPSTHTTGVTASVLAQTAVDSVSVPNLLAQIPGADPDIGHEIIVVGCHFDHLGTDGAGNIYNGADDNASGTSVVLELAELFADWDVQPARTMVFAAFNAEELGLVGSMYYVIDPPFALDDTVAMLNLDMVGAGDESGVLDFGGTDEGSEWMYDLLVTQASEDFPVTPLGASTNSDHAWFQYAGVPIAFLFTVGAHSDYHQPSDTFEGISGWELEQTAQLSWDTLRVLAMGEEDQTLEQAEARGPAPELGLDQLPPTMGPLVR